MQKIASKHSNNIQARASAMMITELFGHVTLETHFLEFRLLAGTVQRRLSPGNNASAAISSIFGIVPGRYRKQWLCKILI